MKDFLKWLQVKKNAHETEARALFHEREIWWCKLGSNVGYETDGHGETFERPVLIVKKFNLDTCISVPLTAKSKEGKYYFSVGKVDGRDAIANLSQLRLIDQKRLTEKIETLAKPIFKDLLATIVKVNFMYDDSR